MIDRQQVAAALEQIGLLLELLGENPFKTRAYGNAARIVRGLDEDLGRLVQRGELTRVRGIGAALAEKIATLVRSGELPYLEQLREQVPPGLLEWLKIPGLGAKKARAIHIALGISTLAELENACRDDRLNELPGFGKASQKRILGGIALVRRNAGRFLQPLAQSEARRLLELISELPGVTRAEIGGSVRRKRETSKDIDIVVSGDDDAAIMDAFCSAEGVEEVTGRGPTKCSVRLSTGPSADLRVVADESFPFALMYFTGSKAHNIAVRARAQKLGFKLNEYALVREKDDETVPCRDEAEIYRMLGIPQTIPPELREDLGELEAAQEGSLPQLVRKSDLKGVLHVHSSWSDGSASIEEMAEAARGMGLSYLGLCDHSQAAAYAGGLNAERVEQQHAEIDELNRRWGGSFRVIKGIEVDILHDGKLDFPDDVLRSFELVVASVHSRFELDREQQTERILRALENPFVDMLGHVTGRLLLARDGYPLDLPRILESAADRGVAVEVNAHPHRLDLDWRDLRYAVRRGVKTAVNPDAHSPQSLEHMDYGVNVARKGWCTADDVLNALPCDRFLQYLERRRRLALERDRPSGKARTTADPDGH